MAEGETGYLLSADLARQLDQTIRKLRSARVSGARSFINSPDTFAIVLGAAGAAGSQDVPQSGFWVKITGHAQDGANKRWFYAWSEAVKTSAGYGGWQVLEAGRSGTTSVDPIYNIVEEGNGSGGAYHNGVASSNLSGTFDVQPIPDDTYLWCRIVYGGDEAEYWVQYENAVDGACP